MLLARTSVAAYEEIVVGFRIEEPPRTRTAANPEAQY
jgi:hypothetical protein